MSNQKEDIKYTGKECPRAVYRQWTDCNDTQVFEQMSCGTWCPLCVYQAEHTVEGKLTGNPVEMPSSFTVFCGCEPIRIEGVKQ